jgi:carbon storage regulator
MLVLNRYTGQKIILGDNEVVITVITAHNGQARIGIKAPREMPVHREEIFEKIKANENDSLENRGNK